MKRKRRSLYTAAVPAGLVLGCAGILGGPGAVTAQTDSVLPIGATLRGWEQEHWLKIYDRGGSFFGRTSERGILQRFNEQMDFEYHLDVISYSPSLLETYDWYRRDNGWRGWGGSINHLQLIEDAQVKLRVPLGATWSTDGRIVYQETLEARRTLLWLRFNHELFDRRASAFFRTTLNANKSEIDFELGFKWRPRPGEITVSFGALDLFSDLIFQQLKIGARTSPNALDYISHPYTARLAADLRLARRLRLEAYGLVLTPTELIVESQTLPDSGFVQAERYAYAGGLLEWSPGRATALGGFATWARARIDRAPLAEGRPEDAFDLSERSWSAGVYGIRRFRDRLTLEAWLARAWRAEQRTRPDTSVAPEIDYEDRHWAGRATLTYRARSGFRADLGLDFVDRDIVKEDAVPGLGALRFDNLRLRLGLGWHFGRRAFFLLGANQDLDDSDGRSFDGAYGRFAFYW